VLVLFAPHRVWPREGLHRGETSINRGFGCRQTAISKCAKRNVDYFRPWPGVGFGGLVGLALALRMPGLRGVFG